MKEVDSIFATDSIVKLNPIENALGTQGEVEIYDTDGNKLLLLSPEDENDPNATITNVQVFDSRYKTEKGLNSASTFKDVKTNYTVSKVETTINSVVVFLKDSEIYLTIDKKELPENSAESPISETIATDTISEKPVDRDLKKLEGISIKQNELKTKPDEREALETLVIEKKLTKEDDLFTLKFTYFFFILRVYTPK